MSTAIVRSEPPTPQLLARARLLLEKAETLSEVLNIRNMAHAYEHYFKAAKQADEIANDAAEMRLRAERKAGEMLIASRENGTRATGHAPLKKVESQSEIPPKLQELGIERNQSHRWQEIARVPTPVFEKYIEQGRTSGSRELTTSALMHMAKKADGKNKQDEPIGDPDELPSPEEARRIAIETGKSVLDSEGWYQPPISIERQEEIARTLDLLDLVTELPKSDLLKYSPGDLLNQFAGLRKQYQSRLRDVSLDRVIAWLVEFEDERKRYVSRKF